MKTAREIRLFFKYADCVLLAILLAGCDKENNYRLAFSHNLHVTENGIACTDCHGKMVAGRFAAPRHSACKECHGDWIETQDINAQTCGMCHKAKALKKLPKTEYAKPTSNTVSQVGGVFRHSDALKSRCADCHGMLMGKNLKLIPGMTHKQKVGIRDQSHRWGMNCITCHENMDRKTPPPSHSQNWKRRHGTMGVQPDNACGVCHSQASCRECHQVTMPAAHNNLWRTKTHGIQAAWNRAYCLVCHQDDSCTACHASTRPQSHNAGWAKNHCQNCHTSKSTGSGCTVCHKTDIGTHPNPHSAGWLNAHCNGCHPGSPESGQCAACHGWSGLDSHPTPHPSGWRSSHCNSCHAGTPAAEKCGVCHTAGIHGHPNPHSAGWQSSHCNNCHPGTPEAEQCGICHGVSTTAAHRNPHSVGWHVSHCFSCHPGSPDSQQCRVCHPGGSGLLVHQGIWPDYHNRFGGTANVTLCYNCHDAAMSSKLRLRQVNLKTGS